MSTSAAKATRPKATAESPIQRAARAAAAPQPDQRPATVAQRKLQADISSSPRVQQAAAPVQRKENNTGLPDNLKAGVEGLSGYSLDDVKVHYNSAKPAGLQAHAYAQGTDIHVAPGQEQHLPHEAWHVAQQKQGRVKPTLQLKSGVAINDNSALEKEADVMGAQAVQAPRPTLQRRARATASASAPAQLVKDESKRPILDTRVNDLKAEAVKVLGKMMVLGADWETKYGQKGKEKGSNILGEPTDYKAELRRTILKEYWKTLSTEEKIELAQTGMSWLGKGLGALARGGREALGLLPESGEKEKEETPKKSAPKKRTEEAPSESWLNSLTLEDVQTVYRAYSRVSEAFDKYAQAKAAVQEKAGEIGEAVGAEVGRWRDEADFNKRMGALRQEFETARTRYELLDAAIVENADRARYEEVLDVLQFGLANPFHGPGMVYLGSGLTDKARKDHPDLCVRAIQAIEASSYGSISETVALGVAKARQVGRGVLKLLRIGQEDDQSGALAAAQSELATELATVVNKSWSAYTKWGWTPTGVKAIQKALPKKGDDLARLRAATVLAKGAQGGKSDNRSAETQIFYDALADVDVANIQSLKVAKSIIEGIGAKLG